MYNTILALIEGTKIVDISNGIQIASAIVTLWAAVYLARFKYTFIEELKKIFLSKPQRDDDFPVTQREVDMLIENNIKEHRRFDDEFSKLWAAISHIQDRGGQRRS